MWLKWNHPDPATLVSLCFWRKVASGLFEFSEQCHEALLKLRTKAVFVWNTPFSLSVLHS
jgi:hypothetical protein